MHLAGTIKQEKFSAKNNEYNIKKNYVPIKQIIGTIKRRPSFNLESTTLDPCLLLTGSSTIFFST
jgi:hypothetical protein